MLTLSRLEPIGQHAMSVPEPPVRRAVRDGALREPPARRRRAALGREGLTRSVWLADRHQPLGVVEPRPDRRGSAEGRERLQRLGGRLRVGRCRWQRTRLRRVIEEQQQPVAVGQAFAAGLGERLIRRQRQPLTVRVVRRVAEPQRRTGAASAIRRTSASRSSSARAYCQGQCGSRTCQTPGASVACTRRCGINDGSSVILDATLAASTGQTNLTEGGNGASRTAFDRPRRRDHRLRGRRRHRHQGAGRPRGEGAPDGGRPDGRAWATSRCCSRRRASGIAAPARWPSSTPPARARRSTSTPASPPTSPTSPTRWRRAATSAGSARASSAAAPTTTRASSCATPTTTSSRSDYDGVGWNWPISYQDIAPYYDKAERLIGVTGKAEGIRSAPDGIFQTPAALKPHEILVQKALREARDPRDQRAPGGAHQGRRTDAPACHYCGQCGRGCAHGVELRVELRADLPGDEDRQRHRR